VKEVIWGVWKLRGNYILSYCRRCKVRGLGDLSLGRFRVRRNLNKLV